MDFSRIFSGLNGRTVTVLLDDVFWRKQSFNSVVNSVKTVSDNHSANWSLPIFLKQFATVRKLFSLPTVLFHVVSKDKQGWSMGNSCSKKKYFCLKIYIGSWFTKNIQVDSTKQV